MPQVREGVKCEKQYTEENVLSALEVIENGMSQRKSSEPFNVPRQTLQFRKSSKFTNKTTLRPSTVLTSEEESILKDDNRDYLLWRLSRKLKSQQQTKTPIRKSDGNWARSDEDRANTFTKHLISVFQLHSKEVLADDEKPVFDILDIA
ncbi:hypothetical protein ILUMI_18936 [Ignelater luminosus]|uniref:HTH psq-type domain-containing protein n=1 Tax=Ignelater luminosus TaxID=2038154 RepID=A0A8K0CL48_IGNLU|nr:hypothetical protein ILUMI_18936 [Ignelater luminosus]